MAMLNTMARNVASLGQRYGLPEMNVSEWISGTPATTAPYPNSYGGQVLGASTGQQQIYPSNQNSSPYIPATTKQVNKPTAGTSQGNQGNQQGFQNPFDQIQFQDPTQSVGEGGSPMDAINQEFSAFNDFLNQEEGRAQSNAAETTGLYESQAESTRNQYGEEKTTQTEELKKAEGLNLKKVRQLLGELSQRNAARTAIGGGGSMSEVLAERFGREAQSRLGNVMETTRSGIQRVNTFYDNAITKLNDSLQAQLLNVKQTLEDNLSNIRQNRMQSAAAKQQNTLKAWQDFYSNVNNAKVQAASFKAQYDLWKQQNDATSAQTEGFNLANVDQYSQGIQSSFSPVAQGETQVIDPVTRRIYSKQSGESDDELARRLGLDYSTAFQLYTPGMT